MPKQITKSSDYQELVKRINTELSELDLFVRRRTAEGYWRVGKFIHEHLFKHKDRADYGRYLLESLSDDVDKDASTLSRALKFYRLYPILAVPQELSWDHYRQLITVQDKKKREEFERIASKKGWTAGKLSENIRLERLSVEEPEEPEEKNRQPAKKLSLNRGRLYAYGIVEPAYIHGGREEKVVDLGFSNNIQAEIFGVANLKDGETIETKKAGDKYSFRRSDAKPKDLYTYLARVERVIDADTLWLNVDCGFKVWTRQKIRLRGIDAPEIATPEGKKAKEYVEARLKGLEFVVVKTHKDDKYGRYLADVFYLAGEEDPRAVLEEGAFLNQELLSSHLAELF